MRDPKCVFCKIAGREIPKEFAFENDELMAFADIHPVAPVHLLILPKEHNLRSIAEMADDQQPLVGRMLGLAKRLAEERGIAEQGYRLVFNVRHHAGQEVDHLHLHLIGGQPLGRLA